MDLEFSYAVFIAACPLSLHVERGDLWWYRGHAIQPACKQ